jgi:hypothetical protein
MQKWEYLYIFRNRGWEDKGKGQDWHYPAEWKNIILKSTGREEFTSEKFLGAVTKLGNEGWELVDISPRSDYLGGHERWNGPVSNDYAGFTTNETWVFKRPKE